MIEQEGMELKQYFAIIRRWLWLIGACALLAGIAAYLVNREKTPIYAAEATLLLDTSRPTSATPAYSDLITNERLAETYAALLTQREAIESVKAQLAEPPRMVSVVVNPQRNTSILQVVVTSENPQAAAYVANNLAALVNEEQRARQAGRYAATKTSLSQELDTAEQEVTATRALLAQLDADAPDDQLEYSTLSAKLALQERTHESLRQQLFSIRLAEDQGSDILAVIEQAQVPTAPIGPNTLRDVLTAMVLGALVGFGMAFLIEYLDDTLKADTDVAGLFGLGVLALIGKIEQAGRRVLVSSMDNRAPITEAYRILRTNIRFSMVDEPLRTLLITSPGPSEGKSTTAANLALVMAQAGHRTIVVDADLRRPVQHTIFGMSNTEGLTTALVERDHPVEQYLRATGTSGLFVLPSGPIPPNPSELLGSHRMRELLRQLQEQADYVVIDTSPVLAVTDSSLLASIVSGVVLVVRANATRLDAVRRTLEQLHGVQANVLGTVLNDVRNKGASYYYYIYYQRAHQHATLSFGARMRTLLLSLLPRRG